MQIEFHCCTCFIDGHWMARVLISCWIILHTLRCAYELISCNNYKQRKIETHFGKCCNKVGTIENFILVLLSTSFDSDVIVVVLRVSYMVLPSGFPHRFRNSRLFNCTKIFITCKLKTAISHKIKFLCYFDWITKKSCHVQTL